LLALAPPVLTFVLHGKLLSKGSEARASPLNEQTGSFSTRTITKACEAEQELLDSRGGKDF